RYLARADHEAVPRISPGVQGAEHRYRRRVHRHGGEPDLSEKPEPSTKTARTNVSAMVAPSNVEDGLLYGREKGYVRVHWTERKDCYEWDITLHVAPSGRIRMKLWKEGIYQGSYERWQL